MNDGMPAVAGYREAQALVALGSYMQVRQERDELARQLAKRGTCATRVFSPMTGSDQMELVLACVLIDEHGGLHCSADGTEWADVDQTSLRAILTEMLYQRGVRVIPGEDPVKLVMNTIDELNDALIAWSNGESGLHNAGRPIVHNPAAVKVAAAVGADDPLLGLATTRQLLDEIRARGEAESYYVTEGTAMGAGAAQLMETLPGSMLEYRTVDVSRDDDPGVGKDARKPDGVYWKTDHVEPDEPFAYLKQKFSSPLTLAERGIVPSLGGPKNDPTITAMVQRDLRNLPVNDGHVESGPGPVVELCPSCSKHWKWNTEDEKAGNTTMCTDLWHDGNFDAR